MTDIKTIQELRARTGAGMMDCKLCLEEAGGDIDKAIDILRKKGIKNAAEKEERQTTEGWIGSYIHSTGKIAALVSLACETDFVARTDEFKALAKDIAMHVAATSSAEKDEVCLLNQPFVKDDQKTVGDVIKEHIAKLGENIEVREIVRMTL